MVEGRTVSEPDLKAIAASYVRSRPWPYRRYMASVGIPIVTGYYIDDLKEVELGYWEERECNGAFIQLSGMEGVAEARITEIPPGGTVAPMKRSTICAAKMGARENVTPLIVPIRPPWISRLVLSRMTTPATSVGTVALRNRVSCNRRSRSPIVSIPRTTPTVPKFR